MLYTFMTPAAILDSLGTFLFPICVDTKKFQCLMPFIVSEMCNPSMLQF